MDIPIELFLGFTGISIVLAIFGFLRNPQIPATIVMGGMFLLVLSVATTNIIMGFSTSDNIPTETIYNVINTLQTADISATGQFIRAEYPSTSASQLYGESFDCITVNLRKVNSPPISTLVSIGVFNANGDVIKLFGTINVTNITTEFFFYQFCLNNGDSYTIGTLPSFVERIGIKYNAGDATNRIQTRFDNTDPFDSTITFLQSYNGVWTSTTGSDLTMILTLRGEDITTQENLYEFTELPKTLFALIGVMIMLIGGLMVMRD